MIAKMGYRWVIAIVLFVAYSIQYLDRVKTSVLNPSIAVDLGLSSADIGTGAFLMLLFYGPSQYITGILTDKFGAKKILIFSVISWSALTAFMGFIQTKEEYFWRMAIFGLLVGTEFVPSARILMRWFNKEGRARAQALLSWAWILTPAWASIFATQIAVHASDWRIVFFITGAMGIIPLVIILWFVYDRPEHYKKISKAELEYAYQDEIDAGLVDINDTKTLQKQIMSKKNFTFFDLFKSKTYVAIVFVDVVMQIVLYGALTWIPLYLADVFGFKLATMGYWSAMYFAAGAIGSFVSSYLSDKVFRGNRRIMILTCFIGLTPFILLLATLNEANHTLLALALCGMGFFANMAWGPFLTVPAEIFTPEVYGKAMGFVNGVGYFVAAFSAKIFGSLVVVQNGVKDYSMGWIFITGCTVVGIIASIFIKTSKQTEERSQAVNIPPAN
ncbi:MFS transporter [Neobacillus jeddahensis]|uniref:MFS transporter n=1 Tax=Neobacillus jeddahensis TaxID=1461580 RepID=UPI00058D6A4C|nr:MFS transporter [Neobacillus jeddahensis]